MKHVKKLLTLFLALSMVFGLAACGTSKTPAAPTPSEAPSETPAPQKPVILVVSFGTSYNESRDLTIGAVEEALQAAYPDYEVRRAFTSQIIIDILKDREKLEIDNVTEAMERLVADGVKEVIIQPTHVMNGYEYDDLVEETVAYADKFDSFKVGATLLASNADYDRLVTVLAEETAEYNTDGTAIVFMGHGTEHDANATYAKLQRKLTGAGYNNYFVGTVEAEPTLEDVMALVKESGASKVVLLPLMIVAGDHATNDMAGDEEDSWKSVFEAEGFEVECVMKGLGQYEGAREMIVDHAGQAMEMENGAIANEKSGPIYAGGIADGTYEIEVDSSSSMFKVVKCELTVENGAMSAVMTLSGQGYGMLYMGTGEEALAAGEDAYIPFELDSEGAKTFTVPVEALDLEVDCAAWSIKKEQWYDRVLVFESDLIPAEALIG